MTSHPITPPPELVYQWVDMLSSRSDHAVFSLAAQWGADQELEACAEYLKHNSFSPDSTIKLLHAARRPKPPSLKEQSLGAWGRFTANEHTNADEMIRDFALIRRALEALPNG